MHSFLLSANYNIPETITDCLGSISWLSN